MSSIPLRKNGPLVEPFTWPASPENDPPRALKALSRIVDGDLCHRCGSCVGICPTKVLGVDHEEYPIVENISACTDCDLCVRVCPGDEVDAKGIAQQLFNEVPDLKDMHGHFEQAYLAYAKDPELRKNATSGGLVTGLLLSLLERGEIDGAVVIDSHPEQLWKGLPRLARTRDEIVRTAKSKYAIAPTNIVLQEIRNTEGRFALVGLPCQIHGFQKAARLDKRIRERVVLTIGIFCHAAVEHEPMREIWDRLGDKRERATRFISRVGKHPGTPHIEFADGTSEPLYFPERNGYRPGSTEMLNVFYRLYTPQRCLTCYDSTSEFADIAVGDPWLAPPSDDIDFYHGYSFTMARTTKGRELLRDASSRGAVHLVPLTPELARTSNTMMGIEKRWRAFRVIETRRRQGLPVPEYGFDIPHPSGKHLLLTEMNMLSHVFCFLGRGRKAVLHLFLSPAGYNILRLNHYKRRFRNWRQDMKARWRRWRHPAVYSPLQAETDAKQPDPQSNAQSNAKPHSGQTSG